MPPSWQSWIRDQGWQFGLAGGKLAWQATSWMLSPLNGRGWIICVGIKWLRTKICFFCAFLPTIPSWRNSKWEKFLYFQLLFAKPPISVLRLSNILEHFGTQIANFFFFQLFSFLYLHHFRHLFTPGFSLVTGESARISPSPERERGRGRGGGRWWQCLYWLVYF